LKQSFWDQQISNPKIVGLQNKKGKQPGFQPEKYIGNLFKNTVII